MTTKRKRAKKMTAFEKLLKRYRTQQQNLRNKRAQLVSDHNEVLADIDAKLTDVRMILSRLEND